MLVLEQASLREDKVSALHVQPQEVYLVLQTIDLVLELACTDQGNLGRVTYSILPQEVYLEQ